MPKIEKDLENFKCRYEDCQKKCFCKKKYNFSYQTSEYSFILLLAYLLLIKTEI